MKRPLFFIASCAFAYFAATAAPYAAAQNFAPPVALPLNIYNTRPPASAIALADINGDGFLDVIAAYPGYGYGYGYGGPGDIEFSFGDGKGNFAAAQLRPTTSQTANGGTDGPLNLTLGDFNNDGRVDVICPMSGGVTTGTSSSGGAPFNGSNLAVFLGDSAAMYYNSGLHPTTVSPTAALVADFNRDGIPDVAVASASGLLTIYLGAGGGLYRGGVVYYVGGNPVAIRSGDFNHDGRPDLATVNSADGTISVLISNGNGTFQRAKRQVIGANLQDAALADLNRDGRCDIVALRSGEIDVFLGNADGTFTLSKTYPASSAATALLLADFSGSGKLDALTNDAVLLRGIGSAIGNTSLATYSGNIAVGDVNGDGKLDFVVGNQLYLNIGLASSSTFSLTVDVRPEGLAALNQFSPGGNLALRGPGGIASDIYFVGAFIESFPNLPANGCSLRITAPNYLTVDVPLRGTSGAAQYLTIKLPAGDANGDNQIDSSDFGLLIGAYGGLSSLPGSGYDARADFNHDGSIDSTDFELLLGNFGRRGDL